MANLNRIILVGRLTADPESRSTMDGLPMAKFRLVVNRPQGGSDFIDIVAWRRLAEVSADQFKKGKLVLVEGQIQIRTFDDQAGQRRWVTEVVARNLQLLEQSQSAAQEPAASSMPTDQNEEVVDDSGLAGDLPF